MITEKKIKFERAVGVIIYVQDGFIKNGDIEDIGDIDAIIHLNTKFSDIETTLFHAKLSELQEETDISPENMLGFMVFANVENDPYIQEITMKIIM